MSQPKVDYIIVGGGIAGLHLGALLSAVDGFHVLILEKSGTMGGRARVVDQDGFKLDWGLHAVRYGAKSALGESLSEVRAVARHPPIKFVPCGLSYIFNAVSTKARRQKTTGNRLDVFPTGIKGFLRTKMVPILPLLRFIASLRKGKAEDFYEMSLKDWMNSKSIDLDSGIGEYLFLIGASALVCTYPERVSVGELFDAVRTVLKKRISVTYPFGGWTEIFDTFRAAITNAGSEIRTKTKVDHVIVQDGRAEGVILANGEEILVKNGVISTVPVQELFEGLLDESLCPPDFVALCRNLRPTAGVVLDIALSRKIIDSTGLYYFRNTVAFGFFPSNLAPSIAPPGKQLFTVFRPLSAELVADHDTYVASLAELREEVEECFPDLHDAILFERDLAIQMADGAEVNVDQHRLKRPSCELPVPGVDNLWVCGDSTSGAGAGGDIGHESVRMLHRVLMVKS